MEERGTKLEGDWFLLRTPRVRSVDTKCDIDGKKPKPVPCRDKEQLSGRPGENYSCRSLGDGGMLQVRAAAESLGV